MIDHDGARAVHAENPIHFLQDAAGISRVMNDAPTPNKVEAAVRKTHLFGIHLKHFARNVEQPEPF